MANVVRLILGEGGPYSPSFGECGKHSEHDTIVVLEANIDDMNPQLFSYVQQMLLTAGALDAFAVPVQMKKGRPGQIFTVLASSADVEPLSRILLTETTTLGVRMRTEQRRILERKHVTVQSPWGPIRVKLGLLDGEVVNFAPEFEDCRQLAETTGVPLKTVLQKATHLYLESVTPAGAPHLPQSADVGSPASAAPAPAAPASAAPASAAGSAALPSSSKSSS
jgi:uncharacterized protein (DUF111 family)